MEAASAVMKRVPTTRQSSAESCPVIMAALHTWMDVIGCCKSAGGRAVMANYYEECSEPSAQHELLQLVLFFSVT